MDDAVAITGIGAITPVGNTWPDTWSALVDGRSGVAPITLFDAAGLATTIAAEVKGFDPARHLDSKVCNGASRTSQFAIVAAREAVKDAGLSGGSEVRDAGVVLNCAVSGFAEVEGAARTLRELGPRHVRASVVPAAISNMPACEVAIDLGVHGPVNASSLACASGAYAMLEARRLLLADDADVVIAGGADAGITPVMFASLSSLHALSRRNDDPAAASRPFDADRDGFVFGEGAVVVVLERRSRARQRGARIYAELRGGALTCDAFHVVAPEPTGEYAARAITRALANAHLRPSDIDYVCAHGTSTRANDRVETLAIRKALGDAAHRIAVSAPKSMTGHMIGAAGALATAICAQAIKDGVIPPTINYRTPDPECDLDYVPNAARRLVVRNAVTNAFGFGGQNCVLALGPP